MAGEGDAERLVVLLEARIKDFERNMVKASGTATRDFGKMRASSKSATAAMERDMLKSTSAINRALAATSTKVGGFGKSMALGFAAPLAGLLTLTAAISGTKAALEKFGAINDQSIAAGVDSEFFQGIAYSAKLSGVEIDTVAGALASFAKASGLAAEGKGRMVSTLQALNPELLKNIQLATSQEARIRLVADAIANSKNAAEAAAIASATLGDAGVKLVAAFQGGAAELDAMMAKAKDLGLIVDRDLIARADDLGDKFDTAAQIVDLKLKSALIDLAPLLSDAAGWAAEFARLMAIAYDQLKAVEDRQFLRPLQNQLAETYNAMQPVKDRIAEIEAALAGGAPNGMILKLDLTEAQAKLKALDDQAMALLTRVTELQGAPRAGAPSITPASPTAAPSANMLGGADLALLDLHLPDPAKIREVADGFHGVRAAAQASTVEIAANADAVDVLSERFQSAQDMASSFASTLIDGALQGRDAAETISNAFADLERQFIQMAADQAIKALFNSIMGAIGGSNLGNDVGAGAGSFGNFASVMGLPGHASGTANTGGARGQPRGIVHGQEAVIPLPNGGKVPVQLAGSGSGFSKLEVRITNEGGDPIAAKSAGMSKDGGVDIVSIVVGAFNTAVAQGKTDGAMRTYGLKRRALS